MLASARISGQREHHGEIMAEGGVARDHHAGARRQQIRAMLADPTRRTNQGARRYLLARPAELQPLRREARRATARGMAARRYACAKGPGFTGCGKTYINADQVEQFVAEAVLHRLDAPEVAARLEGTPR